MKKMQMKRSTGSRVLLWALMLSLASFALGCPTLSGPIGESGADQFGRVACDNLDKMLFLEQFICPQVAKTGSTEDEQKRIARVCHHTALASYHTARATCVGLLPLETDP